MPFITFEEPNLWEEACYEVQTGSRHIPLPPGGERFDPAKHSPVFAGYAYQKVKFSEVSLTKDFDSSCAHPSTVGFSMNVLSDDDGIQESKEVIQTSIPKKCSEVQYISRYLLPVISSALEQMLVQAKKERCFERKRTKFNACDFLTEYLYKHNPFISPEERDTRASTELFEIPFATEWLQEHPRKPLPKSLVWSDEEAATILQSAWRGYLLRRLPEVQELIKWQREWREENKQVLDEEIEKLFSRAQSQASSNQSPRSRPSSKRLSAKRRVSSSRRNIAHSNSSTISENVPNDVPVNDSQNPQNGSSP